MHNLSNISFYSILSRILVFGFFIGFFHPSLAQINKREKEDKLQCGSGLIHNNMMKSDEKYKKKFNEMQIEAEQFAADGIGGLSRTEDLIIPVVVHVVYSNPINSAIDGQINSMMTLLNQNFNQNSPDRGSIPSAFLPAEGNVRVKFILSKRDQACGSTTGITYRSTTQPNFVVVNSLSDPIKTLFPGWNPANYLNIWVTDVPIYANSAIAANQLNGYAYNPANGLNGADGLVIYLPKILSPTVTHEMGHYFNLAHTFGDNNPANCSDSDFVSDTPNQNGGNTGCPSFPSAIQGCSDTGPNGTMVTNFLNYSTCRNMFTQGQCDRMDAAIFSSIANRNYLLSSSAILPPSSMADLFIQDTPDDVGNQPNNESSSLYTSSDIWVRNTNVWQDGISNQIHENPEYHNGTTNKTYIYVRVRNKGCSGAQTGNLKLFWAKASSGLAWPAPWDGSISTPAVMGGEITTKVGSRVGTVVSAGFTGAVSVNNGESNIYVFEWNVPDPDDYSMFGTDNGHFCLLARLDETGQVLSESNVLWQNVKDNNNIAWKNITVLDIDPLGETVTGVLFGNYTKQKHSYYLKLIDNNNLLQYGKLFMTLPKDFKAQNKVGLKGLKMINKTEYQVISSNATVTNIALEKNQIGLINLKFIPNPKNNVNKLLGLELQQYETVKTGTKFIGGERFYFKISNKSKQRK